VITLTARTERKKGRKDERKNERKNEARKERKTGTVWGSDKVRVLEQKFVSGASGLMKALRVWEVAGRSCRTYDDSA